MSRRKRQVKRETAPDPIYNDVVVAKFLNKLMLRGKKSLAQKIFYTALKDLKKKFPNQEPLDVFKTSLENCKPDVEVRSRRVGRANYQIPIEVRPSRRQALAMRWLIQFARARSEKSMVLRLSSELADAYNKKGSTIKKREDLHRMAEANKAFAHYNW